MDATLANALSASWYMINTIVPWLIMILVGVPVGVWLIGYVINFLKSVDLF